MVGGVVVKDEVIADGAWEFDAEVTAAFDDMLERSIPGYRLMRELTTNLAAHYAQDGTYVVDLGCSRGAALAPVIDKLGARNKYVGVEVSQPMREAATQNLQPWINAGLLTIIDQDLRDGYPTRPTSVTLSVLTLMFTPIEYRHRILKDAYEQTLPGGALILVEKVLGSDYACDELLKSQYYAMKGLNGYTPEQINTKRRSLEGVLVPVTEAMNVELLRAAGFEHVDCYWKALNFGAWVAIKGR
jgi:tRNA (cmo5U34)-methyltransferase